MVALPPRNGALLVIGMLPNSGRNGVRLLSLAAGKVTPPLSEKKTMIVFSAKPSSSSVLSSVPTASSRLSTIAA